jgi:hypothetical protein
MSPDESLPFHDTEFAPRLSLPLRVCTTLPVASFIAIEYVPDVVEWKVIVASWSGVTCRTGADVTDILGAEGGTTSPETAMLSSTRSWDSSNMPDGPSFLDVSPSFMSSVIDLLAWTGFGVTLLPTGLGVGAGCGFDGGLGEDDDEEPWLCAISRVLEGESPTERSSARGREIDLGTLAKVGTRRSPIASESETVCSLETEAC